MLPESCSNGLATISLLIWVDVLLVLLTDGGTIDLEERRLEGSPIESSRRCGNFW